MVENVDLSTMGKNYHQLRDIPFEVHSTMT